MIGDASLKVKRADELKVIDLGQDLNPYFNYPCVDKATVMVLQPCFVEDPEECCRNIADTTSRVLSDPRWRLSLQTHKLAGFR